jgi:hypothetical protein
MGSYVSGDERAMNARRSEPAAAGAEQESQQKHDTCSCRDVARVPAEESGGASGAQYSVAICMTRARRAKCEGREELESEVGSEPRALSLLGAVDVLLFDHRSRSRSSPTRSSTRICTLLAADPQIRPCYPLSWCDRCSLCPTTSSSLARALVGLMR